jgi:hypothetical protein
VIQHFLNRLKLRVQERIIEEGFAFSFQGQNDKSLSRAHPQSLRMCLETLVGTAACLVNSLG